MKAQIEILLYVFIVLNALVLEAQDSNTSKYTCSIIEENFESSQMRKFLKTTTLNRAIIDKFINDKSEWAILSIENDDVLYASFDGRKWTVFHNNETYYINNKELLAEVVAYANKKIVYKVECPDNYVTFDAEEPIKAIWIKQASEIKFIYYALKCETLCLNEFELKKIISLKGIVAKLTK